MRLDRLESQSPEASQSSATWYFWGGSFVAVALGILGAVAVTGLPQFPDDLLRAGAFGVTIVTGSIGFLASLALLDPVVRHHATRLNLLSFVMGIVVPAFAVAFSGWFTSVLPLRSTVMHIGIWLLAACATSFATAFSMMTVARRLTWLRTQEPGVCRGCGYSLKGTRSSRCPECGMPIPTSTRHRDHGSAASRGA